MSTAEQIRQFVGGVGTRPTQLQIACVVLQKAADELEQLQALVEQQAQTINALVDQVQAAQPKEEHA